MKIRQIEGVLDGIHLSEGSRSQTWQYAVGRQEYHLPQRHARFRASYSVVANFKCADQEAFIGIN